MSNETAERIEDLQRSIEWTSWLISQGVYIQDKFLTDRIRSMKAELAGLKSLPSQEAV